MSMFPGANAQIYRNEDGEVLGWDYPSYDPPGDNWDDQFDQNWEPDPLTLPECIEQGQHGLDTETHGATWDDDTLDWVGGTEICDRCEHPVEQIST